MRLIIEEEGGQLSVWMRWTDDGERERQGGSTPFASPLTIRDLDELRFYLEDYLQLPSGHFSERGEAVERTKLNEWGEALFREVFEHAQSGPERRNAFGQLRAAAARGQPTEVALASTNAPFLSLPWELMKAPEDDLPIALSVTGFDRTIPQIVAPFDTPDASHGIRLLMVIARPEGVRDAPFQSIARRLFRHVGELGEKVQAEVLRPPSFVALQQRLKRAAAQGRPFHVIHFDGHGTFGDIDTSQGDYSQDWFFKTEGRQGYLCFETEGGAGAELVSAADFAEAVKLGRTPCVVLNACRSGTLETADEAIGAEATVATRLIEEGVASVVAMSHSVYVVAAAAFMGAFYEGLFAGQTVSAALNAARRALRQGSNALRPSLRGEKRPLQDWMVPVHYQRTRFRLPGLEGRRADGEQAANVFARFHEEIAGQAGRASSGELAPMDGIFLGRDTEFYRLERAVRGAQVCIVHGVGGTGKTELAKAFARWLQVSGGLDDPDLVFFESFEPGRAGFGLDQVLLPIFTALTANNDELRFAHDTPAGREALVLSFLRSTRCLLLWDNFETAASMPTEHQATSPLDEAGQARIAGFLKALKGGKSAVLITSRSEDAWLEKMEGVDRATLVPGDVARVQVTGLSRDDAIDYADHLLSGRDAAQARRREDDKGFSELIDYLSGHPLCLKLSLRHLEERTPKEVLAALRGEADALPESIEAGRLAALGASVRYSLRQLDPSDRERLFTLALAEDTTSAIILGMTSDIQDAAAEERPFQVPPLPARLGGLNFEGWRRLLASAADLGLLTGLGGGIYRLHPALPTTLAAAWREAAGDEYPAERGAAELAFVGGAALFGIFLYHEMGRGLAEAAYRQVQAQRRGLEAALSMALRLRAYDAAQSILEPLDEFWDAAGLFGAGSSWCERVILETRGRSTEPPPVESAAGALWRFAYGSEANRAHRRGDLNRAETAHLEILRQVEGEDTPTARAIRATAYHQLGMVAQDRGDLDAAERWYTQGLAIKEEMGDRSGMAKSYHQLGIRAQHLGDLDAAERWYKQGLAIKEEVGDRPGMARSYHQLGMVAQHREDVDGAERWYKQSLAIAEEIGDRPGMAGSYHQLGILAQYRGDLVAAERRYKQSLAIEEETGNRPGMAGSYHQLGSLAQQRKDLEAAERWYKQSLAIDEEIGNRPGMAKSWAQLGRLAQRGGRIEEAFDRIIRAVTLFPQFPNSHSSAPISLADLTQAHGEAALAANWRRVTGEELPDAIRDGVGKIIAQFEEPDES